MAIIKLNKNNLFYNLEIISEQAKGKKKVAVVLKDNAYGHGIMEIAKLSNEFGIRKAVVRTLDEAIQIEKLFDEILILSEKHFHTYSHTFHIALNSIEDIKNLPSNSKVQIKVDSGMHRNGILPSELKEAILGLLRKNIKITGVFTHFKNADNLSTDFFFQKSIFNKVKSNTIKLCEELNIPTPYFHSSNSAGLFRHTNFDEDIARVGIAMYGYLDNANIFKFPKLKPVLSLWANKISTRELKVNQSVGYGGIFSAKYDMPISTYDVGYADGFFRLNERKGYITPQGYEVLGKVSMDNLSLNSSDEEVCIFDDATILAKVHDTISYEILTALKPNLKRLVV